VQDIDNLCKKLFSNPNAACRHATFLIEVFVHVAIENKTVYSPKKGPEHRKHDIIDGQTIDRAIQGLKKTHI
jgi:hypothetical protein